MLNKLPLHGIKVVDLSRVLAGPYATQIMGDLGADILKIESPEGDDTRKWGPPFFEGDSAYYLSTNRNKKSVTIDFNQPKELTALKKKIEEADILVENFKPGSLKKHGLDYEALSKRHPRLIYCSISGFGSSGPYKDRPGYDAMIQAMGGLMSITGADAAHPTKVGVAIADISTGLYAVIAVLAALRERETSGKGQLCELALFDVQVSWLANVAMNYLVSQKCPEPMGNAHPSIVPYETFQCADASLFLAVGNDSQFERLCQLLGEKWSQETRFQTNEARVKNRAQLIPLIASKFKMSQRSEWLKRLHESEIPAGPINSIADLSKDPHVHERALFTTMSDGKTPCLKNPIRFSRTPITEYQTPPKKGANSSEAGV